MSHERTIMSLSRPTFTLVLAGAAAAAALGALSLSAARSPSSRSALDVLADASRPWLVRLVPRLPRRLRLHGRRLAFGACRPQARASARSRPPRGSGSARWSTRSRRRSSATRSRSRSARARSTRPTGIWTAGGTYAALAAARSLTLAGLVVAASATHALPIWPVFVLVGAAGRGRARRGRVDAVPQPPPDRQLPRRRRGARERPSRAARRRAVDDRHAALPARRHRSPSSYAFGLPHPAARRARHPPRARPRGSGAADARELRHRQRRRRGRAREPRHRHDGRARDRARDPGCRDARQRHLRIARARLPDAAERARPPHGGPRRASSAPRRCSPRSSARSSSSCSSRSRRNDGRLEARPTRRR